MTPQEVFNAMVVPLLAQGKQSYDSEAEACKYRGPNGLKCAVGFLIPDEVYNPRWDDVDAGVGDVALAIGLGEHIELMRAVQKVHDENPDPSTWMDKLAAVAAEHELVMP